MNLRGMKCGGGRRELHNEELYNLYFIPNHGRGEKHVQGFDGKARRKKTT
jgi:hypothetical protein